MGRRPSPAGKNVRPYGSTISALRRLFALGVAAIALNASPTAAQTLADKVTKRTAAQSDQGGSRAKQQGRAQRRGEDHG